MRTLAELEAEAVAIEHVLWAARHGLTAADVLLGFRLIPRWTPCSWETAVHRLSAAYRNLPQSIPTATSSRSGAGRTAPARPMPPRATAPQVPSPPAG